MAATLPAASLAGPDTIIGSKPSPAGKKRNLLFSSDDPAKFGNLIASLQSVKEYDINVIPIKIDYQKLPESVAAIQKHDADILVINLPGVGIYTARIAQYIDNLDIPVILLPTILELIMLEADVVALLRRKGINAMLANSESHVLELVKILAAPRILEGKKALIFGRPFDSSSVPVPHLNADYIYKHTGVHLEYRPTSDLKPLLENVDEAAARKEMERWKKDAVKIVEPDDDAILKASRMYVLLRSIIDQEELSAISIDCLNFSFSPNPIVPLPCLAYSRLRDEGIAATCEADVCMLLTSLVLQAISRKSFFHFNVSEVDTQKSVAVLRQCVAPIHLQGPDAEPLQYNLRDYHGFGRDVVPEVQFPIGVEVTMGAFSKNLKDFVLWPGRIQPGIHDMETPSFANIPEGLPPEREKAMKNMRRFCSNRADVKIKEADRFLQSIAGIHHVFVAGSYTKEIYDAMARMNVNVIAPPDLTPPEI
jgi:L-fucose isomerase-like protein